MAMAQTANAKHVNGVIEDSEIEAPCTYVDNMVSQIKVRERNSSSNGPGTVGYISKKVTIHIFYKIYLQEDYSPKYERQNYKACRI